MQLRGKFAVDSNGNPEYGERDRIDFDVLRGLEVPFWIGGGITSAQHVQDAFDVGATGVQVGTLFAYCRESGMSPDLRERILVAVRDESVEVATSMRASTTGYPFKVASVTGTTSEAAILAARERKCDLGYLREAYFKSDGTVGYRCPGEPTEIYVKKGGDLEDTIGRTCLCNGLMSTIGMGQLRAGGVEEPPIVTSGDCINEIRSLMVTGTDYSALDVIAHLRAGTVEDGLSEVVDDLNLP